MIIAYFARRESSFFPIKFYLFSHWGSLLRERLTGELYYRRIHSPQLLFIEICKINNIQRISQSYWCLKSQNMFAVGSRQKMMSMHSKRDTTECIATALVCQPCWVSCFSFCGRHTDTQIESKTDNNGIPADQQAGRLLGSLDLPSDLATWLHQVNRLKLYLHFMAQLALTNTVNSSPIHRFEESSWREQCLENNKQRLS